MTRTQELQAEALLKRSGDFSDEEYGLMGEYISTHDIKVGPAKGGILSRDAGYLIAVDGLTASYVQTKATATGKTGEQVIGSLVRRELLSA